MDRRGFLLGEETVKIIIAVICIVGLIAFLVFLYEGYQGNQDMSLAKNSLSNLISSLNSGSDQVYIYNPNNWYIASFPADAGLGVPLMPRQCSTIGLKNCICIYKGDLKDLSLEGSSGSIDFTGECKGSDYVIRGNDSNSYGALKVFWNNLWGTKNPDIRDSIKITNPPMLLKINQKTKTVTKG